MSTTNAKHTPGPWKIAAERNGRSYPAIRGADGGVVATCGFRVAAGSNEDDANAQLIAQAPTMAVRIAELESQLARVTAQRDALAKVLTAGAEQCDLAANDIAGWRDHENDLDGTDNSLADFAAQARAALASVRAEGGAL